MYSVIRARLRFEHDQVFDEAKASVERGRRGDDGLHRTIFISLTVRKANQIYCTVKLSWEICLLAKGLRWTRPANCVLLNSVSSNALLGWVQRLREWSPVMKFQCFLLHLRGDQLFRI